MWGANIALAPLLNSRFFSSEGDTMCRPPGYESIKSRRPVRDGTGSSCVALRATEAINRPFGLCEFKLTRLVSVHAQD